VTGSAPAIEPIQADVTLRRVTSPVIQMTTIGLANNYREILFNQQSLFLQLPFFDRCLTFIYLYKTFQLYFVYNKNDIYKNGTNACIVGIESRNPGDS